MNVQEVSYLSIVSLVFFILPIVIINYKLGISINKKIFFSIGRMVIQLTLVGVFLQYLFDLNNPYFNFLYLVFMIFIASFSTVKSCDLNIKKFIIPLFLSFIIPNIIVLMFFNAFVVKTDNIFNAQYMITIAGMLLGNNLSGNIICINNFHNNIRENKEEYYYFLSISANKIEALKPYFKNAVLSSVNPTIASIETIGLVSLPGMMTGQILGGAIPLTAIKYQIAIMVAILIVRYFGAILSLILTGSKMFDEYDILKNR
ncbi:ABC transporter permease [Tepidibacter mesophilus]|uniref:ABC transporter permease n=1 Tax=Tepidibacter mesophilus TaxID=655607 RepID=UPI000C084142|nr:ABC transporter permease [Tepidibacter mesophilus]